VLQAIFRRLIKEKFEKLKQHNCGYTTRDVVAATLGTWLFAKTSAAIDFRTTK